MKNSIQPLFPIMGLQQQHKTDETDDDEQFKSVCECKFDIVVIITKVSRVSEVYRVKNGMSRQFGHIQTLDYGNNRI